MKTILILLLSCNLYAQQLNDTWDYTYDKSLHLWYTSYISFAASPIYASRDIDNIKPLEGFAFGVLFGTGVNVAKELYDWTGRGHASKQDIAYGKLYKGDVKLIFDAASDIARRSTDINAKIDALKIEQEILLLELDLI